MMFQAMQPIHKLTNRSSIPSMIRIKNSRRFLWKLGLLKFDFFCSSVVHVPRTAYLSIMKMEAARSTKSAGIIWARSTIL